MGLVLACTFVALWMLLVLSRWAAAAPEIDAWERDVDRMGPGGER